MNSEKIASILTAALKHKLPIYWWSMDWGPEEIDLRIRAVRNERKELVFELCNPGPVTLAMLATGSREAKFYIPARGLVFLVDLKEIVSPGRIRTSTPRQWKLVEVLSSSP